MESIQHMVQEARAVQNKVAAKCFKPNNMILDESGFTSYVCDALEIRQSNLIGQLIHTLYPKERQRQVNVPVEDRNGCDEEASDLNSTSETIIYNSPTEISDCSKFCSRNISSHGLSENVIRLPEIRCCSVNISKLTVAQCNVLRCCSVNVSKLSVAQCNVLRKVSCCIGPKLDELLQDELVKLHVGKDMITPVFDNANKYLKKPAVSLPSNFSDELEKTMKVDLSLNKPHHCPKCEKTYKTEKTLYGHYRSKHMDNFNFQCEKCSKKFLNRHHFATHVRFHMKIFNFSCDQCGRKFVRKPLLINHLLSEHGQRHKCFHCAKSYKSATALRQHIREINKFFCVSHVWERIFSVFIVFEAC